MIGPDTQLTVSRTKTTDRTLDAIVSCLFDMLGPAAEPEVLDQATVIMQKIQAQKNPALDTALCQGAAAFFARAGVKDEGGSEGTNQKGAKEKEAEPGFEAFSDQIILALLSHYDHASAPEASRKVRVELGWVLARSPTLTNEASRGRLASILEGWLQSERSRPLRDDIAKAVGAVKSTR